jgi:hypothetical protein
MVWPYTPKALTAPLSTSPNAVSIKVIGSLNPNQAISGLKMSKSTFNIGSLKLLSLYMDLTSYLSSKANIINIDLLNIVKQSPFTRRPILNNLV